MSRTENQDSVPSKHEAVQPARLKFECGGCECISKGLHATLAVGVLIELVSGNNVFGHGSFSSMWIHDVFAVTLLLALAYQVYWWYGVRGSFKESNLIYMTDTAKGSRFVQGMGVVSVTVLCLTGFLGFLFGLFHEGQGQQLQAQDLILHHYLLYVVWFYLTGHLVLSLVRQFTKSPAYTDLSGRGRDGI